MAKVTFFGAAGTVTGSRHLLEANGKRILIDCGLFQGPKELRLRNWQHPGFAPESLDAIVLTHAHIDHVGFLPVVVRDGFTGPIYASAPTKELAQLLLPDSGRLQEEEADYAKRHKTSKHNPPLPLYTEADAVRAARRIKTIPREKASEIFPGINCTPRTAGHILGACSLTFEVGGKTIVFSGDIGRFCVPILPDPAPVPGSDLLICESTYGDRFHKDGDLEEGLISIIKHCIDVNGPLVIPSFAVGRTQHLLYVLQELEHEGKIPTLPVFVDSPMACDATDIYRDFKYDFDDEAQVLIKRGAPLLRTKNTSFCKTVEESKRINGTKGPRIIIAASGMATGGRVLHHLKHLLPYDNTTVLFVGYQAEGTRGRTIQAGAPEIKMFGEFIPIHARIESLSGFSAHADQNELVQWIKSSPSPHQKVYLVHGEPTPAEVFRGVLHAALGLDVSVAAQGQSVEC